MLQAYKVGRCPCCGVKVMVRDSNGIMNAFKPNYRQVDLVFGNGQKVRTMMCVKCFENGFDKAKLLDTITHENTQACNSTISEKIKSLGEITDAILAPTQVGFANIKQKRTTADTEQI